MTDEETILYRLMPPNGGKENVVNIQTEFMNAQMQWFNEQAKVLGEIYTKAGEDAVKVPFGVRKT